MDPILYNKGVTSIQKDDKNILKLSSEVNRIVVKLKCVVATLAIFRDYWMLISNRYSTKYSRHIKADLDTHINKTENREKCNIYLCKDLAGNWEVLIPSFFLAFEKYLSLSLFALI